MQTFVDLHIHILPTVDDGASTAEETVAMLQQAYREGVRTIVATPHFGICNPKYKSLEGEKMVNLINRYLAKWEQSGYPRGIDPMPGLKVVLGNELLYTPDITEDLKSGAARTLGDTNYVLVEFYPNSPFATLVAAAREMTEAGYKPIFAHIERYSALAGEPEKVDYLRDMGVLMQVNASSFLEHADGNQRRLPFFKTRATRAYTTSRKVGSHVTSTYPMAHCIAAWELLENNQVDLIASDAHGSKHRVPVMQEAIDAIREAGGDAIADKLIENANKIFE